MTISTIARAIDPVVAVRDVPAPDAIEGLAEALTLDNASGRGRRRDIATAMRLVARNLRARALAAEARIVEVSP